MKKKEKPIKAPEAMLTARFPQWVIVISGMAWLVVVLWKYYNYNPVQSSIFQYYFSIEQFGIPWGIVHVLGGGKRLLFAVAPAFLILLAGFAAGRFILKLFKVEGMSFFENGLLSVSLGTGALMLALFFVGIFGFLYPLSVWGLIVALDLMGLYALFRSRSPRSFLRGFVSRFAGFEKLWLFAAFFISAVVLVGAIAPETFYDSMVYHLAKPNFWNLSHRIVPDIGKVVTDFFPGNANLIYAAGLMLNSNGAIAKSSNFIFTLLGCGVVYALGRRFSGKKAGFFGAMLFFSIPYVGLVSYRSAMEMPLAFFESMAVFSLIMWMTRRENRWLVLSGVHCGLALGIKYTAFYCFVSLVFALMLDSLLNKRPFVAIVRSTILLGTSAAVVALPWWIFNFFYTGNPLYPFFSSFIGHLKPRPGSDAAVKFVSPRRWRTIFTIIGAPWTVTMGQFEEAFIGPALLLFAPFFFFFKSRWKQVAPLLLYFVVYWILWSIAHELYVRYFLPALPLFCFLCAWHLFEAPVPRFVRTTFFVVFTFIVAGNISFVMNLQKASNNSLGVDFGYESEGEYLNRSRMTYPNPYNDAAVWINKNTSKDSLIALMGEQRSQYIERRTIMIDFSNDLPVILWAQDAKNGEEYYEKLRQMGVTHILLNVPEAHRLTTLDLMNFEQKSLGNFGEFWSRHVRQVYASIADNEIIQQGIFSTKHQAAEWWSQFSANHYNYVYVYELLPVQNNPAVVPFNYFMTSFLYPPNRWKDLSPVADEYWKKNHSNLAGPFSLK